MNIAFIPARLNSKRLPKKPLLKLSKLSLLTHTFERVKLSKQIDKIFVCSSDKEIQKEAEQKNYNFILTKGNFKNGTERIAYAVSKLKKKIKNIKLIIDIQCDNVFLNYKDLDYLIKYHNKNKKFDIIIPHSLSNEKKNKNFVKITSNKENKILFLSRQDVPFDFNKKNFFLKKHLDFISFTPSGLNRYSKLKFGNIERIENVELLRAIENNMKVGTIGPFNDILSINTKNDLMKAKKIMKSDKIFKIYEKKI